MRERFYRTLVTIAGLLLLKGAYALLISPLATPLEDRPLAASTSPGARVGGKPVGTNSGGEATETAIPQHRRDLLDIAREHLPHAEWANRARYAVRTSGSYVFADEWEKEENSNRVVFSPFALVWRSPDSPPEEPPLTIVCDAASLEFAEKFDIRNPNPGRVVGGSLQGPVSIRGPNGLVVETRNLSFSEASQRAWSDNEIEFAYGPHRGRAHGLELDLIGKAGPRDADKPAIDGIRTIRLVSNVKFQLQPGAVENRRDREGAPTDQPRGSVGPPRGDGRDSPVTITCTGSFEYKLEVHVALFNKNVVVIQPTGGDSSDRLSTDLLTLEFERDKSAEADDAVAGEPDAAGDQKPRRADPMGDLKFRWLRASGPGTQVTSDRSQMRARMDELTYDEPGRTVVLRGANPVRMVQKNNGLKCPEITALLDEDNQIEQAHCRGAGTLLHYTAPIPDSEDEPLPGVEFSARWDGELRMEPEPNTGFTTIDLQKRVVLTRPGGMRLSAERVRVWVEPDDDLPPGQPRVKRLGEDSRTRPQRMLALRQVELKSPQMIGATERLEIWFEVGRLAAHPGNSTAAARSPGTRKERDPGAGSTRRRGAAGEPAVTAGTNPPSRAGSSRTVAAGADDLAGEDSTAGRPGRTGPGDSALKRDLRDAPILVSADVIRVQMLLDGDDAEVSAVRTEGHVHVTQSHGADAVPLDVKGDQLQLWNYLEERQVLRVQGKPAHVHDRGLQLEGADIRFDRGANLAGVDGAGVLRLPVRNGIDGKRLESPQLIDIFWREKMEFDGQTAKFFAAVRTQFDGTELFCEEMHVHLTQRISFIDESAKQTPELKTVVCREGVTVKSHEYKDSKLTGIREARGYEFTFDQKTGDVQAEGPGVLTFWTRGAPSLDGRRTASTARANKSSRGEEPGWSYTRVNFSGKMRGNSEKRRSQFFDRVNVVYGPVASATEVVEIERLPLKGGWLKCEELTVTQQVGGAAQTEYVTVLGKGNVELEGRSEHGIFTALAHTVSFDQSKGLYVISGDGRRDAEITREASPGSADRGEQRAQRMEFIPALNRLNTNSASSAQGGR